MECFSFLNVVTDFFRDLAFRHPRFDLNFWLIFGFIGQLMFTMRFIVQWIASERKKESVIPVSFWYLSLAGGLIVLLYAIYRMDPVSSWPICQEILSI
jgi:lipid-A-disaccharide synthase-like uncharacterized protein